MKRRSDDIEVRDVRGWPVEIRRDGRVYRVREMLDAWVVQGHWWGDEEKRVFFRVRTDRGAVELYRTGGRWVLSKELD